LPLDPRSQLRPRCRRGVNADLRSQVAAFGKVFVDRRIDQTHQPAIVDQRHERLGQRHLVDLHTPHAVFPSIGLM
jgi:hypothetical protein